MTTTMAGQARIAAGLRRKPQSLAHWDGIRRRVGAYVLAAFLIAIIGWADYATGPELSSFPFYSLPVLVVVWSAGSVAGWAAALLCAAVWAMALLGGNPYQSVSALVLAVASRFGFFALVVLMVDAVRKRRESERARIETLERTRELERAVHCASEKEQQRIGRELHDGLCQTLAGIVALSATLSKRLQSMEEWAGTKAADEITELLRDAIAEARDLARGLHSAAGNENDLPDTFRRLALDVQNRFGVLCSVQFTASFPRLEAELVTHLLRIAQEAIQNAITHGRAERIAIDVRHAGSEVALTIHDDGIGLPEAWIAGDGIGTQTMRARARLLGGSVDIRKHETKGTVVACRVRAAAGGDGREVTRDG